MKREENQTVEYKESWHEKYLAWICGYANAHGGTIYFGIEDKTKKPVGVKNANKLMEDIPNSIRNTMGIVADVALLRKNGKDVIRVKVKKSMFPVCYHGEYHYRTGAVKMVLTGPSLTQFLLEKSGIDWDASPTFSGFKKDEHAFTALAARYLKERGSKLTDADFESFGLALSDGRLTNVGAVFADDCPLRHSRVFCTRWNGLSMAAGVMDAKDNQEFAGGLLSMLQYAEDFVRVNSRHSWHKLARTRIEFVEYPERSVHEALVNAFIHRDYLVTGSEVHVDIFDDRIEITSPGGMPGERKIEDFDTGCIPSIRRNPLLADMCERLRIMERRGSGFKKIFEDYTEGFVNPGGHKPILESHPAYFRITLPNMIYGFTDEQLIAAAKNPKTPVVTPDATPVATPVVPPVMPPVAPPVVKPSEMLINEIQWKILRVLHEELLPASKLAAKIGICKVNNVRRRYLRLLLDMGLVEYTIPNKPNSKRQQYRLTVKGHELIERQRVNLAGDTAQTTTPETTQTTTQTTTPETTQTTTQTGQSSGGKKDVTVTQQRIMDFLFIRPTASRREIAVAVGSITENGVKYNLARLQKIGLLKRVGPDFGGHWEVLK